MNRQPTSIPPTKKIQTKTILSYFMNVFVPMGLYYNNNIINFKC